MYICIVRVNDDDGNSNTLSIRNLVANADCQRDSQCRVISVSDYSCFRTPVMNCTVTGP